MLIESGDRGLPPEEPARPDRRRHAPDLTPLLRWVHVCVVFLAGILFPPGWPSVLLMFTAIGLTARVALSYLPAAGDLRDHRQ